ncbi:hypothetical protein KUTeg_016566 [Tegillarca granosa]|uniref:Uncharacterized protein n=1 Tax=Tegillarca granosa TaxID=220873 RepID=A0ABQ9EL92_TEGGR|nr:hypothetical protein KUTeg_016566 [Tegillarca granosa]
MKKASTQKAAPKATAKKTTATGKGTTAAKKTDTTKTVEKTKGTEKKPQLPKADPIKITVKQLGAYAKANTYKVKQEEHKCPTILYGKPLVFDMLDMDLYETLKGKFDSVQDGLLDLILDRSITKEEYFKTQKIQVEIYIKLIKEEDGPEYDKNNFSPERMEDFMFIVVTTNPEQHKELTDCMQQNC